MGIYLIYLERIFYIMYVHTNDKGEIIGWIGIGAPSEDEDNWYEVADELFTDEIRNDVYSYKLVDGQFVLRDDALEKKLSKIKEVKTNAMSRLCNTAIVNGFDHEDGYHYSLQESDQLKLQNLALKAIQGIRTSWKYDGGLCKFYSAEEMLRLTEHAEKHITYHQTYFNQLKHQISLLTSIDDVIAVTYGMDLDEEHSKNLKKHTDENYIPKENEFGKDLVDNTDYQDILNNRYLWM